ncbi:hypothetical protein PAMP_002290 [Pampus punctatissimus]
MMKGSASILRTAPLLLLLLLLLVVYSTDAKMEIIFTKQDVLVGEEILLLCKAGGEGRITWQKNKEDIDDEDMVINIDETSSKFLIKKATMEDMGKYTCQCEFDSGHEDETSILLYVYEGPSFGSTTTYHEFLEGKDGMVPCQAFGKPAVDVVWLRDNKRIPMNDRERVRQQSDNALFIEKVRRDDAGTYVCQAQIRERSIKKPLYISVVINAPPSVHMKEEEKKVLAGPETTVSLTCEVDGLPKPNITWNMPMPFDPSHHHFNSDRSELTIKSVTRADYGEYVCTAKNKIAESTGIFKLHVFEAPDVSLSSEQQSVPVGGRVSVSCNVSGHPQPELHWLNKYTGQTLNSASGHVHVVDGVLVIEEVLPSHGGLYSCMAVSPSGNASRDVAIHTRPGQPHYLSVSPEETSILFSLKTSPDSGGTPITSYVLQWRQSAAQQWKEITVPSSDVLTVNSLKPYTLYMVRLAAMNAEGLGNFSDTNTVRTKGIREPESPVLLSNEMKVEGNSFSVPLIQNDNGGTPLLKFNIRYGQNKEGAEWKENELPSDADAVSLQDLSFGSEYQLEVVAVNANGSSVPARFNFTTAEQLGIITKGSVVGIVMVIFLVVFLVVDITCCYKNRCGLLMFIAVKLFGQNVPGLKQVEEGEGTNGEVKMNGLSTPRGSMQQVEVQTKEGGGLTEVTCDKAPLTKHEKIQPGRGLPTADA